MDREPLVALGLRCAHKDDPLGVEPDRVRFSWRVDGAGTGRQQTAYQVRVGLSGDGPRHPSVLIWDSGRIAGEGSSDVAYEGEPLAPAQRFAWQVRVWDEGRRPGAWSALAPFETALDAQTGWRDCSWIGLGSGPAASGPSGGEEPSETVALDMRPAPYLRRVFTVGRSPHKARLYVTALGVYQASINGRPVGDNVLAPGWTDYHKRVLYQTYDITELLVAGENVIGVIVADGWACGHYGFDAERPSGHYARSPQLLAQVVVTFPDGSEQRVVTDEHWQGATGAIAHADLLMGERRDQRLEPAGWDRPGYGAAAWHGVSCHNGGNALVCADPGPPVRVTEEVGAKSVTRVGDGEVMVDFGQNLVGWARLKVDEPPGALIRLRHGEVLAGDGSLYVENLRRARQTDMFTTAGGKEVLEPRLTFHGFRYAEVTGLSAGLAATDAVACVVQSDTPRTGFFECSSTGVNQLYANIDWGQRGNFVSIPTDCPQRDERLGWLGDAQIFVRTAAYNRDVASFFSKWLDDVGDAQLPSGAFTDFAPSLGYDWVGAPAWGDAGIIVPWTIYKMYGDRGVLERNLRPMEAWMDFLSAQNPDRVRAHQLGNNYGDWLAPNGDVTPPELIGTAYWAYDASLMAEVSEAVGRPQDAARYRAQAAEIRDSFIKTFVTSSGRLEPGTQTAYVLALHMALIPDELRAAAAAHLVETIDRADGHLGTGFVGVGYLLPVLSANGYSDVAYRLLEQRSYPSWLYSIDRGATTIWERWDGWTEENGFQSAEMNSFNHYSLGSVGEWLYRFVLGIDLAPGAAGFDRLVIRPHPGGSLTYARGSFRSVRGEISTAWHGDGARFTLDVGIPANVRARVCVPSAYPLEVVGVGAGPMSVDRYPGALGQKEAVFEVGSGRYSFSGPPLMPAT